MPRSKALIRIIIIPLRCYLARTYQSFVQLIPEKKKEKEETREDINFFFLFVSSHNPYELNNRAKKTIIPIISTFTHLFFYVISKKSRSCKNIKYIKFFSDQD